MLEGHTQGTNLVVVGTSLKGWEHREVDLILKVILAALRLALLQSVTRLFALHTMHALGTAKHKPLSCWEDSASAGSADS